MAASRSKRVKPGLDPEAVERELTLLAERVRTEGAVKLSTLKPKALRDSAAARLGVQGFELNDSWVRRPVREQLREALAHGALMNKKSLASVVRGVTAPELTRALKDLEASGEVRRVLRGKSESFTGPHDDVLGPDAVRALSGLFSALAKALTAADKKGATLLASDIEEALGRARDVLPERRRNGTTAEATRNAAPPGGLGPVLEALDALRDKRTGLSFVPSLVQRLSSEMPVAVAHEVLLAAARQELIELRPEGGLARLTNEELGLCPPGPGGTRLSWARRLGGGVSC
jgi:hypothetical protein